jgi:ribosomal protein L7Ae-like RNA K-turn-binding protein
MWLSAERDVLNKALERNVFAKAARRPVVVPADLTQRIEALLARRCLELLGLARRAGQVVAGFDQVRSALAQGQRGIMVEAADGAVDGRDKLHAAARDLPVVRVLTGEELGAAFGRDRFVHVLVETGRLAERLSTEAQRLAGFRTNEAAGYGSGRG